MRGDFTRNTFDPKKNYTRVRRQQGRVDVDADFNEQGDLLIHRDRVEAGDVIGRYGVPLHGGGFRIEVQGGTLIYTAGRLYLDGILCEAHQNTRLVDQPGFTLPTEAGTYVAYLDVWDRYVTAIDDPRIKEVALGGPDTAGRVQTAFQVRLHRIDDPPPFEAQACIPFPAPAADGKLSARTDPATQPDNPCEVGTDGGFRGLENRLYRVEIHDDGRDAAGNLVRPVTYKWSRDNGSVVLEVAPDGIDGDEVSVLTLGPDAVLTVSIGDWVEVVGETDELRNRAGLLAQVTDVQRGGDDFPVLTLDRSAAAAAGQKALKVRRWDQRQIAAAPLTDGAREIHAGFIELEDGVQVRFDATLRYQIGDHWLIPARTRTGNIEWPSSNEWVPRHGVHHHHGTLAMVHWAGGAWNVHDCRPVFPPLTEVDRGGCCITVRPGEDVQAAVDRAAAAGGGCVELCSGVHRLPAPLRFHAVAHVTLKGCGTHSRVVYQGKSDEAAVSIREAAHLHFHSFSLLADGVRALFHVAQAGNSHDLRFEELTLVHGALLERGKDPDLAAGIRLAGTRDVTVIGCRIAAPVGIAAPLGDALPRLGDLEALRGAAAGALRGKEGALAGGFRFQDFAAFAGQARYQVGDTATAAGTTLTFRAYTWLDGRTYGQGFAEPRALGGGAGLWTNNILPCFSQEQEFREAAIAYEYHGGNINVRIGNETRALAQPAQLDGLELGGARLRVQPATAGDFDRGVLHVVAAEPLTEIGFGGQELGLIAFALGRADVAEPRADHGRPVTGLVVRDSEIRHAAFGILACVLEDARLERTGLFALAPFTKQAGSLGDIVAHGAKEFGEPAMLGQLEDVLFGAPAREQGGTAVAAWILARVLIADCDLVSRYGVQAAFMRENRWLRGTWRCGRSGIAAGLIADTRLHLATLASTVGPALVVASSRDFAVSRCTIAADACIVGGSFAFLADLGKDLVVSLSLGLHGQRDEASIRGMLWLLLGHSVEHAGIAAWFQALDALLDPYLPEGVPDTLAVVAILLETVLRQGVDDPSWQRVGLVHLGLSIDDSQLRAAQVAVRLRDFFLLGSLRLTGNRVVAAEGRAVELLAQRFAAHPALLQQLVLRGLAMAIEAMPKLAAAVPALAPFTEAVSASLQGWLAAARRHFTSEVRVEGNNVLSASTAVDTNLYEAIVARNHVTLIERTDVVRRTGRGRVFGRVLAAEGRPVPGVTVLLAGTSVATTTAADGRYQINDVAPGAYRVAALAPLGALPPEPVQVSLVAGEAREVNLVLGRASANEWSYRLYADDHPGYLYESAREPHAASSAQALDLIAALEQADAFVELAGALREGAYLDPETAGQAVIDSLSSANAETLRNAEGALAEVHGATTDGEIQARTERLRPLLRQPRGEAYRDAVIAWTAALMRLVDSRGLLLRSPGCAVVENRIVVARDERAETEALGGIQVTVELLDLMVLARLEVLLDQLDEGGAGGDPPSTDTLVEKVLRAIPATVIAENEVTRGGGHGIALYASPRRPELLRAVGIRGNVVTGLGNAGIWIADAALVVDLAIQDNRIEACGNEAGFSLSKGGIWVDTAAQVDCSRNRIVSCGAGETVPVIAMDLSAIIDLQCLGNAIVGNGSERRTTADGGLRLRQIAGGVQVLHNRVEDNRGLGVLWEGNGKGKVDFNATLAAFLEMFAEGEAEVRAVFAHNEVTQGREGLAPPAILRDLQDLALLGNRIGATARELALTVQTVQRLSAQNNVLSGARPLTQALTVSAILQSVQQGIVVGNISDGRILLQGSPGLITGQNIPPTLP